MIKIYILFALAIIILMQIQPAYCGVSKTMVFQLSVIIPQHVLLNANLNVTPFAGNQIVQTETVMRNNRSITLTTIVVP